MKDIFKIFNKRIYSIGLMSGTSLDGIDVALIEHYKNNHKLVDFRSYEYSKELKERIMRVSKIETSNIQLICSVNKELGIAYTKAIEQFLIDTNRSIDDIYFISNHGQTVWHNPIESNDFKSSTLQLGDASTIAYYFNKIVVYDFRSLDVSAGGIGAPLVPIVNYLLFKDKAPVIFLNIGGISNITYIKDEYIQRCAFLGQNITIREAEERKKYFAKSIDDNGLLIAIDEQDRECRIITGDVLCY